jgi:TonB family protein
MKSSLIISIIFHGIILCVLAIQWHAGTTVPLPEYVYSVRVIGLPGEGGEPGGGAPRGELRITMPKAGAEGKAKRDVPREEQPTVAIPKEKNAVKPESEVIHEGYDLGEPQGEVLPLHGWGGSGGGGSGGGGGGRGGGWGGGVGRGSRNATVEPKPLYIPWPKYPAGMKAVTRGSVELSLLINTRGEGEDLEIIRSLPLEELNAVAVQAARRIRFTPGSINGVRTSMWVRLTIGFQPR